VALILDFSGSMRFSCESGFYMSGSGDVRGGLNPDPIYPQFGHYYAMSQRPLAASTSQPSGNGTGYNPMRRTVLFVDPGGETHSQNNLTSTTAGGDPVVQDFLTSSGGGYLNAFHNPQAAGAYSPTNTPTATPAPDNFKDQTDSPATYVGDKWPRLLKATTGTAWAATVQEYILGTNNNVAFTSNNYAIPQSGALVAFKQFDDQNPASMSAGYGPNFKGYSMGPGYYGKTFWVWPPDPRDPVANPGQAGYVPGDWRKRFFKFGESYSNTAKRGTPLDDNSVLFNATGYIPQESATGFRVNYDNVLAWIKSGPKVFPDNLRAGRILYYSAIPDSIPASGLSLDQLFWKKYIDTVLGVRTANSGGRYFYGKETAGWGTVKITAKASLLNGGTRNGSGTGNYAGNTVPYMHYNDNPIRPRASFWFGPLTMTMFLTEDNEAADNMWAGTVHEAHCWQLKAGVKSALEDIRLNHPNDWACEVFFSTEPGFATPRSTLGRKYTRMKNALFFPFTLLTDTGLVGSPTEIRPYDSSFNYTGAGNIPNARGGTCPTMGFKVAYNEFSIGNGHTGRRGAAKMLIFETDGVPNHDCGGSFNNAGPYLSYYNTSGLGSFTNYGNNASGATDPAVAAVSQICAMDTAGSPGYSTTRTPARVHAIGFGDLFDSGSTQMNNALAFLLRVQQAGYTSAPSDSSIESYKIISGTADQRIDKIRQALERIMQSGVQVSLIQ